MRLFCCQVYIKKFSNRPKHMKIVVEIFVIPRNMSFAVLRSSLLIPLGSVTIYTAEHYINTAFS